MKPKQIIKGWKTMTTENIGLFKAMSAKMRYLDERQRVLSQNIANADTPGFQPRDMVPVNFGEALQNVTKIRPNVSPTRTNSMHIAPGTIDDIENKKQKKVYESAPAGNAVILEEQMVASNETNMNYNLVTTLYQKNVNMIRTALGRTGG